MPETQLVRRYISAVPDLLGNQPAPACEHFERSSQLLRGLLVAGGELEVRALTGEEWPCATDAHAIEWLAACVFPVPIAFVAMPGRPTWRLDLEQRVNQFHCIQDTPIVGCS